MPALLKSALFLSLKKQIYLFMAAISLFCCTWAFSSGSKWGLLSCCGARVPGIWVSVAVVHRSRCARRPTCACRSKASILRRSAFYGPTLTSIRDYWKNHSFDYVDLGWKMMPVLFNMLFSFALAFLPRSKCPLISWLQLPSTVILKPRKTKSVTASTFSPSIWH